MSIFESNTVQSKKQQMSQIMEGALNILIVAVRQCYDLVWFSKDYTPQQMFDLFGSDGEALLNASRDTQILIKKLKPDYEFLLSPKQYSVSEGVVTIIESEGESNNDQPQ